MQLNRPIHCRSFCWVPCNKTQRGTRCCCAWGKILMQTILAQNFLKIFSGRYFSFCMPTEEFYINLKRKTTLPLPVIYICWTNVNTCSTKRNDPSHFDWPITVGKVASVSRKIVNLFVSKLYLCQAQQYLFPLVTTQNLKLWQN